MIDGRTGPWETVIGLEVHAQVVSKAKLFSGAATEFGAEPNTQVSPVDAAFPGMLPVIKPVLRRAGGQDRARSRCRDQARKRIRPQELLATPTCRQAIRFRNISSRSSAAARSCSTCRTGRRARSALPGCTSSRTLGRACTTNTRRSPMSTSTGRALH